MRDGIKIVFTVSDDGFRRAHSFAFVTTDPKEASAASDEAGAIH